MDTPPSPNKNETPSELSLEESEWQQNLALVVIGEKNTIERRMEQVVKSISAQICVSSLSSLEKLALMTNAEIPFPRIFVKDDDCEQYILTAYTNHTFPNPGRNASTRKIIELVHVSDLEDHDVMHAIKFILLKLKERIHRFIVPIPASETRLLDILSQDPKKMQIIRQVEGLSVDPLKPLHYVFHPPMCVCALVEICDKDMYKVGAAADFKYLESLCDPDIVSIFPPKNINEMTKNDFFEYLTNIQNEGIERVVIYYSGCSHNGEGTNFPALPFKDGDLSQPELDKGINDGLINFCTIIFGYDSGNTPKPKLVTREGGGPKIYAYVNKLWDYEGRLYFTGAAKDQNSWAHVYSGGVFTQNLHRYLIEYNGDWLAALNRIKEDRIVVENTTIDPYTLSCGFICSPCPVLDTYKPSQ